MPSLTYPSRQVVAERYIRSTQPTLYLPLCKRDGLKFISEDAYGHRATVTGALWRPDGRGFDGTDDKITITPHVSLTGLTTYTIEAWLKLADQNLHTLWSFRTGGAIFFSTRWNDATEAFVGLGVNWTRTFTISPAMDTNWHHIIFEVTNDDITTVAMYIDLVAQAVVTTVSTGSASVKNECVLGVSGVSEFLKGIVGEIRIYNRLLAASEKQRNNLATKWRYQ